MFRSITFWTAKLRSGGLRNGAGAARPQPCAHSVISATKSATGHLLGAAGAIEAVLAILALRDQMAPPTRNLKTPIAAAAGLELSGPQPRPSATDMALSNSLGFGGVNTALLFRRPFG